MSVDGSSPVWCRYAIREPSGDHVGSNCNARERVRRTTSVPSTRIDQTSSVPFENTIRPSSVLRSMRSAAAGFRSDAAEPEHPTSSNAKSAPANVFRTFPIHDPRFSGSRGLRGGRDGRTHAGKEDSHDQDGERREGPQPDDLDESARGPPRTEGPDPRAPAGPGSTGGRSAGARELDAPGPARGEPPGARADHRPDRRSAQPAEGQGRSVLPDAAPRDRRGRVEAGGRPPRN